MDGQLNFICQSEISKSPTIQHTHLASSPPHAVAMELSELEQSMVLKMREVMEAKVRQLTESLKHSDNIQDELAGENRYLNAWINDLVTSLDEHGIVVPVPPGTQYY